MTEEDTASGQSLCCHGALRVVLSSLRLAHTAGVLHTPCVELGVPSSWKESSCWLSKASPGHQLQSRGWQAFRVMAKSHLISQLQSSVLRLESSHWRSQNK